jgi:hypothetical protein
MINNKIERWEDLMELLRIFGEAFQRMYEYLFNYKRRFYVIREYRKIQRKNRQNRTYNEKRIENQFYPLSFKPNLDQFVAKYNMKVVIDNKFSFPRYIPSQPKRMFYSLGISRSMLNYLMHYYEKIDYS